MYLFFSIPCFIFKDFNLTGNLVVTCSIDHYLKIWNMDTEKMKKAIDESESFSYELK
jgi:hypothetical protein